MNRLKQLIGETKAIFASVLCLLSFVLLAPLAQAAEKCTDCITFSADAPFGIMLNKGTRPGVPVVTLEYSTDQINWDTFSVNTGYKAAQDGDIYKLHVRGTNNYAFAIQTSIGASHCFTNTADSAATAIACAGNTLALLDYETVAKGEEPTMGECAFACLFNGFAALTAAPDLPATNVTQNCYSNMFADCTSLATAPELPAMTLTKNCYYGMFQNCTSLTAVPELPATNLAGSCYNSMFSGCTALTDVPDLPSTHLSERCYRRMFYGCTALVVNTNAPGKAWSIPKATTTREFWSSGMFKNTSGNIADMSVKDGVTYYIVEPVKIPYGKPAAVENATFKVCMGGEEVTDGMVWSNRTGKVESPADPVATVVYTANPGYAFEDGTTEKTVAFDTRVSPAVLAGDAPAPAGKAELKLGVVAQRYPWNGMVDVGYRATYWPADKKGAVEVKIGESVTTNVFAITGCGAVTGTAQIEIPTQTKGKATFKAIEK